MYIYNLTLRANFNVSSILFCFSSDLRLQLLDPKRHSALVEALYGLLMLLPQTKAFTLLHDRLNCLPPAHLLQ